MWISRDKDSKDYLNLTFIKPTRVKSGLWIVDSGKISTNVKSLMENSLYSIPIEYFPSLTWEDEPIEVEFIKKNKWYNSDEINNILTDLGYDKNISLVEIEKILENFNIKIKLFKTEEVLKNSVTIPNSWMYIALCGSDDFSQDFTEYITKENAYESAILESLSYIWLNKKNNKKNGKQ